MAADPLPLRDIHLPEAISWWPPAPGWWLLLAALAILGTAVLIYRRIRSLRLLKRTVLAELEAIRRTHRDEHNPTELVQALSTLMRRASISFYRRSDSASLTGAQWLQHLDRTAERKEFEHGTGSILATAPYLPADSRIEVDINDLLALCEDWLRRQPVKGESS
jgi:hypothetical protein